MRDATNADARSTLVSILYRERGAQAVRDWLTANPSAGLTGNGIAPAIVALLEDNNFPDALSLLERIDPQQMREEPYLLYQRAIFRFASIFSARLRQSALTGVPLDLTLFVPVLTGDALIHALDGAADDFAAVLPVLGDLGLAKARRIAEAYLLWCALLHPTKKLPAIERLRHDIATEPAAMALTQFAYAYDPSFDPTALKARLVSREHLGGLDDDELRAALIVRLHGGSARDVTDFIAAARSSFSVCDKKIKPNG